MSISRSFDPVADHYAFVNYIGMHEQKRDAIANEMYDLKHDALERIDAIIHPEHASDFVKILQYCVNEGLPEAETIAKKMGLNQGHFLALDNDERGMREFLEQDCFSRIPDVDIYDYDYDRYI